jgi:flavin reductase (DIM6/NTAB) family NADH-FMN oxidoreductase RutF/rubredoxin
MDLNTFYKIECGMYIVSTAHEGKLNGQIVNAVVQVTAEPPKIAVSLNKQNLTCQLCLKSGVFSVSVLEKDTPMTFIGRWGFKSGRELDKFVGVEYRIGQNGSPIVLEHAIACFEAKVTESIDAGTHMVLIAEVTEAEIIRDEEPMDYVYYRTVKKGLTSKFAATYQAKPATEGQGRGAKDAGATAQDPRGAITARMAVLPLAAPARYRCNACGFIYDPAIGIPDAGIKPGTLFENLPADWKCPVCGAGKDRFTALPP